MGLENGTVVNNLGQTLEPQEIADGLKTGFCSGRKVCYNGREYSTPKEAKTDGVWAELSPQLKKVLESSETRSPSPTDSGYQSDPSTKALPTLSGRVKQPTAEQLKQKAIDKAQRSVAAGYILGAIAIVALIASIGLGIHTHSVIGGLLGGVGSVGLGCVAYGLKDRGEAKLNELVPQRGSRTYHTGNRTWTVDRGRGYLGMNGNTG